MAKKKKVTRKTAATKRANRGWRQKFTFVKTPKIEPPKESVYGAVYYALRKLKSGTVHQIVDEAMKNGLAKYTKQNYRIQTQVKLRRLVRLGAAKKEKITTDTVKKTKKAKDDIEILKTEIKKKAPAKKAPAKKAVAKKKPPVKKAAPKPKSKAKKDEPELVEDLDQLANEIDEVENGDTE